MDTILGAVTAPFSPKMAQQITERTTTQGSCLPTDSLPTLELPLYKFMGSHVCTHTQWRINRKKAGAPQGQRTRLKVSE